MCFGPSAVAVMKGREMLVEGVEESSIFAFSAASVRRCSACLSFIKSTPSDFLKSAASHSTIRLSKSSPPRNVSPEVESTSKTPSPTSRMDTSKVPPPRSKIKIVSLAFFSNPYANDAAVGSLMILRTSIPAIWPASLVACLCESLKYAGTVITALVTVSPRYAAASSQSFRRIWALISSAAKSFPAALHWILTLPLSPLTAVYGTSLSLSETSS
mmetsp:Transcript_6370/g.21364  ORF Transcript_6370/g.21364 Transcript_6370/m.21364 type:complete len:215 (+) Transcript_6370:1219-1863(+)